MALIRDSDPTSPYLRQHADNPVDWHEWGDEPFDLARDRDRPVILSVGYASCHWCHVMAHESFEDEATASFMNEHFVNVKVDREERPDVDRIYMDAVQAATGHGGWPMTVFLTPDRRPFFAGTYFPKVRRSGHASFADILEAVVDAWRTRRDDLEAEALRITEMVDVRPPTAGNLPGRSQVIGAVDQLAAAFDDTHGGFGGAPKFPQAPTLEFLMRAAVLTEPPAAAAARDMLARTLDAMSRGGIYDHLVGGFARYSVDGQWLVPHFEKMLYDNALLARTYLRSWQILGDDDLRRVATETLDYLVTEMMDPSGGLHSAEDADAAGVEGSHAVWSWTELGDVLGGDRDLAAAVYGASPGGNFEGSNVLHLPATIQEIAADLGMTAVALRASKAEMDVRLRERRSRRPPPERDDKVVTAWNAFALRALAEAGAVLGDDRYLEAAGDIATFLTEVASGPEGLVRSWRDGRSGSPGFCDDHAATAIALFTLYEATGDERWYEHGARLTRMLTNEFADPAGGFYATRSTRGLITRPKNLTDNPTPSDNALAAEAILMLASYTGEPDLWPHLEGTVRAVAPVAARAPAFAGQLLAVWLTALSGVDEIAIVGPELQRSAFARVVWERFRPSSVLALGTGDPGVVPLLRDRPPGPEGSAYVCRDFVCGLPATSPAELRSQLESSRL